EHPDPDKLLAVRDRVGPATQLVQCVCGWGDQHNAEKIMEDQRFAAWALYGFAKPDPATTLPPDDDSGNAKNIRALRGYFNR
ncbi:MAG: hypothetical protein HYZ00_12970, partial [Candidatus Hydrogenedentes bacterium]|nr:hypothetical protein [Candidatus Hydrogenedentota bacterium]